MVGRNKLQQSTVEDTCRYSQSTVLKTSHISVTRTLNKLGEEHKVINYMFIVLYFNMKCIKQ